MSAMGRPEADAGISLGALRDVLTHALSDGRTSLLLMLRAEIDGLAPESLLADAPLRPLRLLDGWLAANAPAGVEIDHEALAMVIGAAMLGLASCQPMLAAGVGLEGEDPDEVLRRCVDLLVGVAAVAIGAGPQALGGARGVDSTRTEVRKDEPAAGHRRHAPRRAHERRARSQACTSSASSRAATPAARSRTVRR